MGVGVVVAVAALLVVAASSPARADWVENHLLVEATGGPGWRVAVPITGSRVPGFLATTIGGDLLIGIEVRGWLGVLVGGRGRWGDLGDSRYAEATGALALQARMGERLKLRLGATAGRAWRLDPATAESPHLVGGFLESAVDVLSIATRSALSVVVRLDLLGPIAPGEQFPDLTLGMTLGLGGRY